MTATTLTRPVAGEYAPFYQGYVARVPDGDLVAFLDEQMHEIAGVLDGLSESQGDHRYAPDKWSIKELVGHVTDAERVFSYRALRFARGDETPLAGFDQEPWVANSEAGGRTLRDMADEFRAVRLATITLARSLTDRQVARKGTASNYPVTVRGVMYIIAGHAAHHLAILRERYLG